MAVKWTGFGGKLHTREDEAGAGMVAGTMGGWEIPRYTKGWACSSLATIPDKQVGGLKHPHLGGKPSRELDVCREEPILTPCWNCSFNLLYVAFVTIIMHNGLPYA